MFIIHLPTSVHLGDTVDVQINGEPARVTYRNTQTLVIEPDDARHIVAIKREPDLNTFICADQDGFADFQVIDPYNRYQSPQEIALEEKLKAVPGLEQACA
jgi:hypothetical protein